MIEKIKNINIIKSKLKPIKKNEMPFVAKPIDLPLYGFENLDDRIFITNPSVYVEIQKRKEYLAKIEQEESIKKKKEQEEKKRLQQLELEQLRQKKFDFQTLLEEYKQKACNFGDIKIFEGWELNSSDSLSKKYSVLEQEVSRANMINDIYNQMVLGAAFYIPDDGNKDTNPYDLKILEEIIPENISLKDSSAYKNELQRMLNIYIENSRRIEAPLKITNKTVEKFFNESGKKIKEIFDLKEDKVNKWLERIPKLGIIPKALRVSEQKYLCKGLLKDYEDVTKTCFHEGMLPLLKKYYSQFIIIKNFIEKYSEQLTIEDKSFNEHCFNKLSETKTKRMEYYNKLLRNFTNGGMNLNNLCKNIEKRGNIELATKTVFTLLPFIC